MRESEFIEWIRTQSKLDPATVPVGPGDDTAVVMCGGEKLLVTVDQLLDGVHFKLAEHGPQSTGGKAMARSLSDVAAMAALPLGAVVSFALPKGMQRPDAEAMFSAMKKVGDKFRCPIVGGDVGVWAGPLAVTVTVFARPAGIKPILRSGAKVGDAVCVTGSLMKFIPRIHEARIIASRHEIHAMIDLSDGLASDLNHICQASDVGADITIATIPIHNDAKSHPTDHTGLTAALSDGEDYELCFCLPQDDAEELIRDQPLTVKVSRVGTIVADKTLTLVKADGTREPMQLKGWEHET